MLTAFLCACGAAFIVLVGVIIATYILEAVERYRRAKRRKGARRGPQAKGKEKK